MAANVRELGVVKVAKPCHRDWDAMTGDARARFCADCKLTVYNLSELTTDEARELIREREGQLCVRFYTRDDGTVITRDCPVGVRAYRRKLVAAGAGAASLALAGLAFAVTQAFSEAEQTPCELAPIAAPAPMSAVKQPASAADSAWMEQRRNQLGPRAVEPMLRRTTMGAIQIVRGEDNKK